jgi:hypothetical protein
LSYTIFCKETEKWLKQNNLPYIPTRCETETEREARLLVWDKGYKHIFEQWLNEKRYKELISLAHSDWVKQAIVYEPLLKYFIENAELSCLQVLCERRIRYDIEHGLLFFIRQIKECEKTNIDPEIYNYIEKTTKVQNKILENLNRYIAYLEKTEIDLDYLESVKTIKKKVIDLSIRKSDLKVIKNKL